MALEVKEFAPSLVPTEPLVAMRGISKAFGPNQVLREVDFDVRAGEVHALLGENGAGKSTLMKVLMGVHKADSGAVALGGRNIVGDTVKDNLSHGIAMIFQELSLLPNLTVGDNILIGREPRRAGWTVDRRSLRREAQAIIDQYRFPLRAAQLVRELGFAQRQMVEILKAVSRGARVLVLDEPTSSLSLREEEKLFAIVDDLKTSGIGLVYISHRMAEIFRLADRLSIVKDGRIIGPLDPSATSIRQVSELMSKSKVAGEVGGHSAAVAAPAVVRRGPGDETALSVEDLRTEHKLRGLSFALRRGEILGVAGLVGSGRSTLAKSLFGLLPDAAGRVAVAGKPLTLGDSRKAMQAGLRLRSRGPPPRGPRPEFQRSRATSLCRPCAALRATTACLSCPIGASAACSTSTAPSSASWGAGRVSSAPSSAAEINRRSSSPSGSPQTRGS